MFKSLGDKLKDLFKTGPGDDGFFEDLEDILIEGDVGVGTAGKIAAFLREEAKKNGARSREELLPLLRGRIGLLIRSEPLEPQPDRLNVFLVLGVNGVGKTTTIAKLADYYRRERGINEIVLGAGDTFRAGAVEQLALHGKRLGLRVVSQEAGADPGAVIYDTIGSARARGERLVLADTAGRLHNKAHLVRELQKIDKIITSKIGDGIYRKVLIIDAVTGQNGLRQAEIFHEALKLDSIILTKYDSTARGGIVVAISRDLGVPISFLGVGEKLTDLKPFSTETYLDGLLGGI
jgi:fused signal recognition particle receptor